MTTFDRFKQNIGTRLVTLAVVVAATASGCGPDASEELAAEDGADGYTPEEQTASEKLKGFTRPCLFRVAALSYFHRGRRNKTYTQGVFAEFDIEGIGHSGTRYYARLDARHRVEACVEKWALLGDKTIAELPDDCDRVTPSIQVRRKDLHARYIALIWPDGADFGCRQDSLYGE